MGELLTTDMNVKSYKLITLDDRKDRVATSSIRFNTKFLLRFLIVVVVMATAVY